MANKELEPLVSRQTWWLCGFLFLATVLNYLDRQVLALTAEKIIDEFQLNKEGFGRVISAFRAGYAIFQIAGGWLVDAYGPRAIFPAAVALWSLAGGLTGLARSVGSLSAFRFMLGTGEAFNWPCALKVTQRLMPPKDRPLANGIFNSGAALGAMIAPVLVTFLTIRYGWRSAFVIVGLLGGFWVVGWILYSRRFSQQLGGTKLSLPNVLKVTGRILLKRDFWMLGVSAVIANGVYYFLVDWIPLYLKTERAFSFAVANALSIVIYAGLEAGNILAGLTARKLVNLGLTVALAKKCVLSFSCILMSSAAVVGVTELRYAAVACLTLTALGVAGFLVIYLTLIQDVEPAYVGACSGLLGGIGNLAYGLVSPYVGRLADLHQTWLTFFIIALLPWFAFAAMFFGIDFNKTEEGKE